MKKFSIIIPVYFNELNLPETIPKLLALKNNIEGYQLELVFVDDGSGDKSLDILLDFKKKYSDIIKVVKLTRNFGSMSAIQAGMSIVTGDCIGVIAADLQDPPELFIDMIKKWENGNKAVLAVREDRKDPKLSKFTANLFYRLLKKYALNNYPKGGFDFFLIDKQIANNIKNINEKNSNIMNLIFWLGFEYDTISYVRKKREKGKSKWTISKKAKLVIDSFIGFSYIPIKILPVLGIIFSLSSFIFGGYVFLNWLFGDIRVEGWTTTIILVTFTAGIQMIMLGVLGEYLWRTLDETRKRPNFVIDDVF
jgi:glycosyltransferase involved in cell wall biosynthesis